MSQPGAHRTFRVRQLPGYLDRLQATALLSQLLHGVTVHVVSLAPTVNPWEKPPTKVATVNFETVPDILCNGETEWVLPARALGLANNIIIDDHFWGFTVLNEVDANTHQLDCIAISGLASHAFGSWKCRTPGSNFMWLRDGLPIDLPGIRTILYGYDTKLLLSQSFQTIDDLAISLVLKLKSIGRSSVAAKPLCFLVHSLGGIVFKRAMVILANGSDTEHSILESIRGAIFFGVPNRGMHMSHFLPMVAGYPNENLINQLSPNSQFLNNLEEQFTGISDLKKMRLISVYETERSRTTEQLPSGQWERTGPYQTLVDRSSAIQTGSRLADTFPINKDHSSLVKFSENDSYYHGILLYLHEIYQATSARGKSALSFQDGNIAPETSSSGPFPADVEMKDASNRLRTSQSNLYHSHPSNNEQRDYSNYLDKMVADLSAEDLDFRLKSVEKAFDKTFAWIFKDPSLGFARWLSEGIGIYWISGKPGSGKSTLMKFICENGETRRLFYEEKSMSSTESSGLARKHILGSFFFYNRGSTLQKSFEGLLRSILHQIVKEKRNIREIILPAFRSNGSKWSLPALEQAFEAIRTHESLCISLHLFLDALDEYDGSLGLVAEFIKSVTISHPQSATRIQVCFSSRPWNFFEDNFRTCPGFKIHDHTRHDMQNYVCAKIEENSILNRLLLAETKFSVPKAKLIQDIVQKASGVFIWVKLTVSRLSRASIDGITSEQITRILSKTPHELEEFYKEILDRTDPENHQETYIMLELALRALGPISLADFLVAVSCAPRRTIVECLPVIPKTHPSEEDMDNISRLVTSRCGGLLEIIEYDGIPAVQLMHQTVKDFVSSPNFQQLAIGQDYSLQAENGFSFLYKYTLALIIADGDYFARVQNSADLNYDCLSYACYAETSTGKSRTEIFQGLSNSMFENQFRYHMDSRAPRFYPINSVTSFGVVANLKLFVKEQIQRSALINANPKISLLHCAVEPAIAAATLRDCHSSVFERTNEMIQMLLDHGIDDEVLCDDLTPFQCLITTTSLCLIKWHDTVLQNLSRIAVTLLTSGKNHNRPLYLYMNGRPVTCMPIHLASCLYYWPGAVEIVKLLLSYGVDVNAQDSLGLTPLDIILTYSEYNRMLEEELHWETRDEEVRFEIFFLLVNAGACVTTKDFSTDGEPYLWFSWSGRGDMAKAVLKDVPVLECRSNTAVQGDGDDLGDLSDSKCSSEGAVQRVFIGGQEVFPERIWAHRRGPFISSSFDFSDITPSPYISVPVSRGSSESVHSGDT